MMVVGSEGSGIDAVDRRIIAATQSGLPISATPYREVAETLGLDEAEVIERMQRFLHTGVIRRNGCIPNHYALGIRANGMTVWDVDDERIGELGAKVGALDFVTHCYRRPRRLPLWPFNLFAMVHGRDRVEVMVKADGIAALLGGACRSRDILFSSRLLKKTGLRLTE